LLAISRCFSGDMDAKPRRSFRSDVVNGRTSVGQETRPPDEIGIKLYATNGVHWADYFAI
jgi:hypothetical protein